MIEVYVLLTLSALGYLLNKSSNSTSDSGTKKDTLELNDVPSMKNIYESKHYDKTDNILRQRAKEKHKASFKPKQSGVISYNYDLIKDENENEEQIMSLSGEYLQKNDFIHNNMKPYYGGTIRQNMDDNANRMVLENFTGITDIQKNKCETKAFGDVTRNMGFVNGTQHSLEFIQDRMVIPTLRNNEFPIPQIHVGRGLGDGFSAAPKGGFHQFENQDYAREKCVDELRTKRNPNSKALGISDVGKETYAGRTVDGLKTGLRGEVGTFAKNRVETFYEQTPDMLFKTTGANLKPTKQGEFNVKETNRLTTTREHTGGAIGVGRLARKADPNVRKPTRQQFRGPEMGGAALGGFGVGTKYDHGKSRILVYNNERDVTSTRVYQGNLTSLIKAVIAPLEDMIKITKKQHTVDNPRHFGNMNAQFPRKATIYDPNDVARATIKETTIHDAILGNLRGNEKGTIYDPDDIARTTLKETTLHDAILGNLKGNEKLTTYDPNDIAKTTIKETTIHDAILGNLKGNEKLTIYDPNDVARTTIKETLIHDENGTGTVTGPRQLYVYDPEEVAKKTIRETLDRMDYEMNLSANVFKGTAYDPSDVARKTTKETTVDKNRLYGNIDAWAKGGGYETNEWDAKTTQKEFISDNDYFGSAMRDVGEGYITNKYDAKDTQKQFLSDIEYYGGANACEDKKQMSYENMYNATITENKEVTLFGRKPTQSGAKVFNDCVNMAEPRKRECDNKMERLSNNRDRIQNDISLLDEASITRSRRTFDIEMDDRLDPIILSAFKQNPFTQPLDSVA